MKAVEERWLPVRGFSGYEVSSLGRVCSYWTHGGKIAAQVQRILKPRFWRGYLLVCLYRDGEQCTKLVHALVAEAFLGPRPGGMEVCHGPDGRLSNSVANIVWGTKSKNCGEDKLRDGTDNRGEKHGAHKLSEGDVNWIRANYQPIPPGYSTCRCHAGWLSLTQIAARFGVSSALVRQIVIRRVWQHV